MTSSDLGARILAGVRFSLVDPIREEPRILLLSVCTFLITAPQGIAQPLLPLLIDDLGLNATALGLAISVFALARVVTNIPAGTLTGRFGARFVLLAGSLCAAAGNLGAGLFPTLTPLLGFRFLAGIGSALFITAAVSFVAELSATSNRARLMSIYQTAFLMGVTSGPAIGGVIAELLGLTAPFFVMAALSALGGAWIWARIPAGRQRAGPAAIPSAGHGQAVPASGPLLRNPAFVAICLVALTIFLTRGGSFFTILPLIARDRFHLSPSELGLLISIPAAVNLLSIPAIGFIGDRFPRRRIMAPTVMFVVIALVLTAFSPNLMVLVLSLLLYGIAQGLEAPTATSFAVDVTPPPQRPVAVGVFRTFGDVGLVTGPLVVGLIADHAGLELGLLANAGLLVVVILVFLGLTRERRRRAEA